MSAGKIPVTLILILALIILAFMVSFLGDKEETEPPAAIVDDHPPPPWAQYIPKRPADWTAKDSSLPELSDNGSIGLKIDKDTTLTEDLIFEGAAPERLILFGADSVTLDCAGYRIAGDAKIGIFIEGRKNIRIRDCRIEGPFLGIHGKTGQNISVEGGMFRVKRLGAFFSEIDFLKIKDLSFYPLEKLGAFALEVHGSKKVRVERNIVVNFDQGILIYSTQDFKISQNRIEQIVETGIGLFQSQAKVGASGGKVQGNQIRLCMMGLEIHAGSRDVLVSENQVDRCQMALRMDDEHDTPRFNPVLGVDFRDNIFEKNIGENDLNLGEQSQIIGMEKGPPGQPLD